MSSRNSIEVSTSYPATSIKRELLPDVIAQGLVRIPSFESERRKAEYIARIVKDHFPTGFFTSFLETDIPNRPTLIVANNEFPDVILIGHIDTVKPWEVGKEKGK